jgi:hypothetical protein
MWFFVRLDEIRGLRLADDKGFITRILPLVSGSLLTFLGSCLWANNSWAECKSQLLQQYFPHFVRESLIRDSIVFNFQGESQSLRAYIEQVFGAARFLQYKASESELVDRVVMNFHPSILAHAAFVEKPCSLKELQRVVGLIKEKFVVAKERQRVELDARLIDTNKTSSRGAPVRPLCVLRHVRAWHLNVGIVAIPGTLGVTVPVDQRRRETGRRPEVGRPPGEGRECD